MAPMGSCCGVYSQHKNDLNVFRSKVCRRQSLCSVFQANDDKQTFSLNHFPLYWCNNSATATTAALLQLLKLMRQQQQQQQQKQQQQHNNNNNITGNDISSRTRVATTTSIITLLSA